MAISQASSPEAAPLRHFQRICEIIEDHQRDPGRLIPILHEVQAEYRYLPEEVLTFVATSLGLAPAHVYGVASFYAHFSLTPKGRWVFKLCDGTACHVRASMAIFEAMKSRLNLLEGQHTTDDMRFTVETVSCLGACGLAPVLVVDEEVHGAVSPEDAVALIDALDKLREEEA